MLESAFQTCPDVLYCLYGLEVGKVPADFAGTFGHLYQDLRHEFPQEILPPRGPACGHQEKRSLLVWERQEIQEMLPGVGREAGLVFSCCLRQGRLKRTPGVGPAPPHSPFTIRYFPFPVSPSLFLAITAITTMITGNTTLRIHSTGIPAVPTRY